MANAYQTIDMITKEAAFVLGNNTPFAQAVDRVYDPQYKGGGGKNGVTLRLRKPPRFIATAGATMVQQDYVDESVTLTTATQYHVAMKIPVVDLTMSVEELSKRWIAPAMEPIVSRIEQDGLRIAYQGAYNSVGTPGAPPSTVGVLTDAQARLDQNAAPRMNSRMLVVDPVANGKLIDGLKGLYHANMSIEEQFREGLFGKNIIGFREIAMGQNVQTHTGGLATGTPLVAGAAQSGSLLLTDGWTASQTPILRAGDVFTLSGGAGGNLVNAVNPVSYQSNGYRQPFTALADVNSDAGGLASIPIAPSIVTSGAQQTVTASPSDNATITMYGPSLGVSPQSLAFHTDAIVLGMADLELPEAGSGAKGSTQQHKSMSISIVQQYAIQTYENLYRIDVLYGWVLRRREHIVRLWG